MDGVITVADNFTPVH